MSDVSALLTSIAALTWPAIVLYVLWSYRKSVSELFESAKNRGFTLEVGGQKLTMADVSQQQQESIEDLRKQLLELRQRLGGTAVSSEAAVSESLRVDVPATNVLWVDDNPKNNSFFIELLQRRGYRVDLARSTREGLAYLDRSPYRLVLSDMGRFEDGRPNNDAGIDLLEEIKNRKIASAVVMFCSGRGVREFKDRVRALGGKGITSSPTELRAMLDELAPPLSGE